MIVHRLVAGCLIPLIAACATVHITEADGKVRVERHAGFVHVELPANASGAVAHVTSLGLQTSMAGGVFGFSQLRLAAVTPACHLILWVEAGAPLPKLPEGLRGSNVCVIQFTNREREE